MSYNSNAYHKLALLAGYFLGRSRIDLFLRHNQSSCFTLPASLCSFEKNQAGDSQGVPVGPRNGNRSGYIEWFEKQPVDVCIEIL